MRTVIYGTKGTLIFDNTSPTMQVFLVDENGNGGHEAQEVEVQVNNHNANAEFKAFADCLVNGTEIETPIIEGAKTVAACLAIIESSKTGKLVNPDYNF